MTNCIGDILSRQSGRRIENQLDELTQLTRCLYVDGPIVVWLHDPINAKKTELLSSFSNSAKADGATVFTIDCHTVEPTKIGLLNIFGELLGISSPDIDLVITELSKYRERVVIIFDNFEVFRLVDSWLRRQFIPSLHESTRIVFVSRQPPNAGWNSAGEWSPYFLLVSVELTNEKKVEENTRRYLKEASESNLLKILDAVSVIRRITRPMLSSLCPNLPANELYDSLSSLSFVGRRSDGLVLMETVRKFVAEHLQSADIEQYRHYQKVAWQLLRAQLKNSASADLWRYTADAIYLIENRVIREAFFPTESDRFSVEPAKPSDESVIMDIARRHEPLAAIKALSLWWENLPSSFHVVCDDSGIIVGFYCMAKPADINTKWMMLDPVARNWISHLDIKNKLVRKPSLFLRRWLSRNEGELPSAVQAAAWIDIKRTYLDLRPALRRVYLTLQDIEPYGPVAVELGFEVLNDATASFDNSVYHTAMLDFGPGSVDGWISNILAKELGVDEDHLLDEACREIILEGKRIPLTPLEFGVISMLESRAGEVVSRTELLQQVWGHGYEGGSNVVDAVMRGLRKKFTKNAKIIETVRGIGYRLLV